MAEASQICNTRRIPFWPLMSSSNFTIKDWSFTLSATEQAYNQVFHQKFFVRQGFRAECNPDAIWSFQDNPNNRVSWTAASGRIPTYRTGNPRLWSPYYKRIVTVRERAASMGFCSYKVLAQHSLSPLCNPDNHMIGNAMHVPSASLVIAAYLACHRLT
jgi:site-specific DNA-cytosine methylase